VHLAREAGIPVINMDLIAGLPGETTSDFSDTLDQVLPLLPDNLTLHCLAVKRAARLREEEGDIHFSQAAQATSMLDLGKERLTGAGYRPYYLYRQKQMAGGNENTGYAFPGTEGIYNIRIMEENQTILALGAGGISKAYFPAENRLERAANVADARLYMKRFDEMLARKQELIFRRYETC
jgi:oxygen-independent coproporphyrinogen-3 oxidase